MTEAEWWACSDAKAMLLFLLPNVSERKMRFFVAACARDLLAYRPAAAEIDGWGSAANFSAAIDRVEAYADGCGSLAGSMIWLESPNIHAAAFAVVGVDPDTDMQMRDPLEAITDFCVSPAHWLRDIFGPLPFRPPPLLDPTLLAWTDGIVTKLGRTIYEDRNCPDGTLNQEGLAVLADALEEAGCTDEPILAHLRGPGPHVRGCWPLDLILAKV
jgi:hypothetical protein